MHAETKSKSPLWIGLGPQGLLATFVIGSAVFAPLLLNPAGSDLWSMLLLFGAAAVYVGFAIRNNHAKVLGTLVQALAAGCLVVLAVVFEAQWVVAVGLIGHAVWDAFHLKRSQRYVPWWYAGACIYVDLIAAALLLLK
jgi:uncharacterized membrane protein